MMDHDPSGLVQIDRQPQRATLRSFGMALALLCLGRGGWSWAHNAQAIAAATICLGIALAAVAWRWPNALQRPYIVLGVVTYPLRWLVSYTVLATIYFAIVTPVAVGVRLARRFDKRAANAHSHWHISPPRGDKPSYFRQF